MDLPGVSEICSNFVCRDVLCAHINYNLIVKRQNDSLSTESWTFLFT